MMLSYFEGGKYSRQRDSHAQMHGGREKHGKVTGTEAGVDSVKAGVTSIQQQKEDLSV